MNREMRNCLFLHVDSISKKSLSIKEKYPNEQFEIKVSKGISETTRNIFCQSLPFDPPSDCLEWLAICNGIKGSFIQTLLGYKSIIETLNIYEEWKKFQYFPLADDGCGGYYLTIPIKRKSEIFFPVIYVDPTQSDIEQGSYSYITASSIPVFLDLFLKANQYHLQMLFEKGFINEIGNASPPDFWWPFDKNLVVQNDPEITTFNIALPWEE